MSNHNHRESSIEHQESRIQNRVSRIYVSFEHLNLCNLDLFRISILGFRISYYHITPYETVSYHQSSIREALPDGSRNCSFVRASFVGLEAHIEAGNWQLDTRKKQASSFYDECRYEHP